MGRQCRSLQVTLRVGSLDEGTASLDHEATWLMGHTAQITFGTLWEGEGDLYVDAVLHVPCRWLKGQGNDSRCALFGYAGSLPPVRRRRQTRRFGADQFQVVDRKRTVIRRLPMAPRPRGRPLPVLEGANPCAAAPCQTADHRRGAACCRDLQIEIMCTHDEPRLEALVRSRRPPYLCKVERPGDFSLEAEMISACGYLDSDGIACTLHGRVRGDGRPAKPDLCSEWPPKNRGLHPGCVFAPRRRR
jgi:hypothetical protein